MITVDQLSKTFGEIKAVDARGLLHHPKVLFLDEPTLGWPRRLRGQER
jgi:ABC-type uncharacterized transport system ATPase subunit